MESSAPIPNVTISEAKQIIAALAHSQSVLLLSAPGVGKSDAVRQVCSDAGLECKSLLGTQIAPEDVSGIPRIIGERSVFCPPRILLPENNKPFCLFLDELPACAPDVQKAFYSLLLERRIGEYELPEGTWVIAAGNRTEDRALVRSMSVALVNRVTVLHVNTNVPEWLAWGKKHGIRPEILEFIRKNPDLLQEPPPASAAPFSTPRSWATFSDAVSRMEQRGMLSGIIWDALAYGTLSAHAASRFLSSVLDRSPSKKSEVSIPISCAKKMIEALSGEQSVILFSAPGVGKSDAVRQCSENIGLECKSLLGTQIAPEDVSGIPRIIGERSVFCPPRVLLPENPKKFCLFLDELPACAPDVQKAFYSLILERRLGEYKLPEGTWVVAAGNRVEDRSLVQDISSALMNRLIVLNIDVSVREWLLWAESHGIRQEIMAYIIYNPEALRRDVPFVAAPFSTPRAWASLSASLDLLEKKGELSIRLVEALAFGTVSPQDAAVFVNFWRFELNTFRPLNEYMIHPETIPDNSDKKALASRYFILHSIRQAVIDSKHPWHQAVYKLSKAEINRFLASLGKEERVVLLLNAVEQWGELGGEKQLLATLKDLTGI